MHITKDYGRVEDRGEKTSVIQPDWEIDLGNPQGSYLKERNTTQS